jgi:beta-mannosidase
MHTLSLSGQWQFREAGTLAWFDANVPGGVHTDLLAAGQIPDPFVGDNEARVAWVAEREWEYHTTFDAPADLTAHTHVELVCDGLDTLATVELNGQVVGSANNMFRQWRWDVGHLLRTGDNELLIRFASPVAFVQAAQAQRALPGVSQAIEGAPHLRKAPSQFGWDWGPQLPPIGIWKDLRLEGRSIARLADVHLRQMHAQGRVTVQADLVVAALGAGALGATLLLCAPDGSAQSATCAINNDRGRLTIEIAEPQLWWPNGYGAQPLYRAEITLLDETGALLETQTLQLGLRILELRQEPDLWGRSFEFVVNGRRIFAKGSNWIPADSFPTRISDAQLEALIRGAAETHQNMLRVWGGGFYEEERFYDLCDKYGILVWQDCVFSCSVYPLDDAHFLANVQTEIRENVRRLRHRSSLALWCGNNEMEWGWQDWAWAEMAELAPLKQAYDRFFHVVLPEWIAEDDPDHVYWPSSPSSGFTAGNSAAPNGQAQGDAHYWEVWHGRKPFTAYRDQYPRFMSEFGFQALPPLATIATYADPSDPAAWNMTSYVMERHQKNASGNSLMVGQMLDSFLLPKDFASLVYLSMVLQAEGIRYGVEHWRRHMDRVAGTLYWQLNDCWPVASWSSMDYFGRWKALHYAAKRFYAPLLLSIEDMPPAQGLYVSSDLSVPWQGEIRWSLETLAGEMLQEGSEAVAVAPHSAAHVCTLDFAPQVNAENRRNLVFVAELWGDGACVARQAAFFAPTKHLRLANPAVAAQLRVDGPTLQIDLRAQSLARLVELSLAGEDVIFSDNYFDLPAGRTVSVTTTLPAGWNLAQARTALNVRSVYETYTQAPVPAAG